MQPSTPPIPYRSRWLRSARNASGLLLVITGIPLLVSPLPVAPAIFLGLNLLKDDYIWANRLLGRLRTTSTQLRSHFPHSQWKLAQAALRRQLFAKRTWWGGHKAAPSAPPVSGTGTPPPAARPDEPHAQ